MIEHNNEVYLEDMDRHVSAEHNYETPMQIVVEDMRQGVKFWNNLTMITGGSLAPHKTSWMLLTWELARGGSSSYQPLKK